MTGAVITVSPALAEVDAGTYLPFQADVVGPVDTSVTWQIQGAPPDATLDAQGLFMSPRHGVYTVIATSVADTTATVNVTVSVGAAIHSSDTNPAQALRGYSVTALNNGKILITGGTPLPQVYDMETVQFSEKAWLYDPDTQAYTPTGNLLTPRFNHYAVLLQDGRVLIAGGLARWADPWFKNGQLLGRDYPFAEVYDPVSGTFQALPSQSHVKPNWGSNPDLYYPGTVEGPGMMWSNHPNQGTAIRLADGTVWFVGGVGGWWSGLTQHGLSWVFNEGSDLFKPDTNLFDGLPSSQGAPRANVGSWALAAHHAMALLQDGRVFLTKGLVGGSLNGTPPARAGQAAGVLNTTTGDYQNLGLTALQVGRMDYTITRLADGKLLLVGGASGDGTLTPYSRASDAAYENYEFADTATAEIFDPVTNTTRLVGSLSQARRNHAAILLPTGQVMIVGGSHHLGNGTYVYPNFTELYDPDTGTFSVMDKMDYGLSEPKLALMKDGGVFVAGQIQAPMEAPAVPQKIRWDAEAGVFRGVSPGSAGMVLLVGSGMLGTAAPAIGISGFSVNQGVERFLKLFNEGDPAFVSAVDENTPIGTPSTLIWKKSVPLIADRPALIKGKLIVSPEMRGPVSFTIELVNDAGTVLDSYPGNTESTLLKRPSLDIAVILPQGKALAGGRIRIDTFKDKDGKEIFTDKRLICKPTFEGAPPINVDLVPMDYVYKDASGARKQYTLSDAEMSTFRTSVESTLKELYPVSTNRVNVTVQPFRTTWSEDGKDLSGASLWTSPYDIPGTPSVIFSGLLDSSSAARGQKWTNLHTYFFQQLFIKTTQYQFVFPKNRYIVGVIPVIAGVTTPTTAGTPYTAGAGKTPNILRTDGSHFAVVMNQSSLDAAHEIGHVHGRHHTSYGSVDNPDPSWPTPSAYNGAAIGVPGWSVVTQATAPDKPATKKDIMCYPDDRSWYWISDYNFYNIYQWEKQSEQLGDYN